MRMRSSGSFRRCRENTWNSRKNTQMGSRAMATSPIMTGSSSK